MAEGYRMTSPLNIIKPPAIVKPEDVTFDDLRYLAKDSFPLWCMTSGGRMDGREIEFDHHRYLLPIYMDNSQEIVWQKAAQLGATSYMLMRALWWLKHHQGRKAGLYFPTKEGVENLSKDRLTPLIASIPEIKEICTEADKLGLRQIGTASFYLYHLGGVASKDSVPLDFITFDEVRLCKDSEISQAEYRVNHSDYKIKVFMSTCGFPDTDINKRFRDGSQHIWMSRCGCPDGCDLARTFPNCVIYDDPKRPGECYLRCPKCRYEIRNPQNGRYVPNNPNADFHSYHVSGLAQPKYQDLKKDIWGKYKRTNNMQEFMNATLGLPWIDEDNIGVSRSDMLQCINPELNWRKPGDKKDNGRTAMGFDQGKGYVYVVIADMSPDNSKKRIRHMEIIETTNPDYFEGGKQVTPFNRLKKLMEDYNVGVCVGDIAPNYNDALQMGQEFMGRVWLARYNEDGSDPVQWHDRAKTKATIAKAGDLKFKYSVTLSRFLSLAYSLGEWKNHDVVMPTPHKLVQICHDERTKELKPEAPADRFMDMLPRLVRQFHVTNDETGTGRWEWVYSKGDPHFAHAWNYCTVAIERLKRNTYFSFA